MGFHLVSGEGTSGRAVVCAFGASVDGCDMVVEFPFIWVCLGAKGAGMGWVPGAGR